MADKRRATVHMAEAAGKQKSFVTLCGRFIHLRTAITTNPAYVTCPDCLWGFLNQRCTRIKELEDAVSDLESRSRVGAGELEAKVKNVKRLADELAAALDRADRAERLNHILARSLRSANEETGRLMTLLGV